MNSQKNKQVSVRRRLSPRRWFGAFSCVLGLWPVFAEEHNHQHAQTVPRPLFVAKAVAPALPALPAGVTELKFSDFFVQPVGPRGLQLTENLLKLDGQRVRILGYMAHEETPPPGMFLLTPFPVEIHNHDNSLADDLPASTVRVIVPHHRDQVVPFTPQLMLLTGTLSVGNREEADGRISVVRLTLDPPQGKDEARNAKGEGSAKMNGAIATGPARKGAERLLRNTKPSSP